MLKKKLNKKGFSLVELIVVIAIMAILAAIIIPTVTNKIKDANNGSANTTASTVANDIKTEAIAIISGVPGELVYLAAADNKVSGLKTGIAVEGFDSVGTEALADEGIAIFAALENGVGTVTVQCKKGNSDVQIYVVTIDATTATVEKTGG